MAKIEKVDSVIKFLEKKLKELTSEKPPSVIVGFQSAYAIYVHEDMNARHITGQAKFLEQPARALSKDLGSMIAEKTRSGMTLVNALLMAGLRLQREAQKLTPVDTGNLRNSAFTKQE